MKQLLVLLSIVALSIVTVPQDVTIMVRHRGASGGGGNTHVQGQTQRTGGSSNTDVLAYSSNVTSGHLLTVIGGSSQTLTVSDSAGNSWTKFCPNGNSACTGNSVADTNGCIHDISGGGIGFVCAWFAVANGTGADTVTLTSATNSTINLWIDEWSGNHTFDVSATSNGNSGFNNSCTSPASAAVAGAGELIIGQGADNGNYTYTPTGAFTTNDANKISLQQVMYNLSGSSGAQTFSATLSGSGNWICLGAAFK
jgi:hypothetical protein